MTRHLVPVACVLFLAALMNGCGYHHIGSAPAEIIKSPRPASHAR